MPEKNVRLNQPKKQWSNMQVAVWAALLGALVGAFVGGAITYGIEKSFHNEERQTYEANQKNQDAEQLRSKNRTIDLNLHSLMVFILASDPKFANSPPAATDSRMKKVSFVRKAQEKAHTKIFGRLSSQIPSLSDSSDVDIWTDALTVHWQVESSTHDKRFKEARSKALWESIKTFAFLDQTERSSTKTAQSKAPVVFPASILYGVALSGQFAIDERTTANVQGIYLTHKPDADLTKSYPIVEMKHGLASDAINADNPFEFRGHKYFAPSYESLKELGVYDTELNVKKTIPANKM